MIDAPLKFKVKNPLRDKAILMTLFYTGVRRSELISINVDDIDLKNNVLYRAYNHYKFYLKFLLM